MDVKYDSINAIGIGALGGGVYSNPSSDFDFDWFKIENLTKISTAISLELGSPTTTIGYKVEIAGNLTSNGVSLTNINVMIKYRLKEGTAWYELSVAKTLLDGSFSATWLPSATGEYVVRASWDGNSTFNEATVTKNVSIVSTSDNYVFFVQSNSTISSLKFDSANKELSFAVSGINNTKGYIKITIARELAPTIENLVVYMDDKKVNYLATSTQNSWILTILYTHSTHAVRVILPPTSFWNTYQSPILSILVIGGVGLLVLLHRQIKKY